LELFQELYDLAINEIYDDLKFIRFRNRLDKMGVELISLNLVVQPLMVIFTPHLYKTYFRPGLRLLSRDEVESIMAVISKLIDEKVIHIGEEGVIIMEKAIERLLVLQGWSKNVAWERASYLSREFVDKLTSFDDES